MKLLKNGFSLMELIIVIVIIGILIASVLGMVSSKETAKLVVCKEQILNIKKTTDTYLTSQGKTLYASLGVASQPQIESFVSLNYKFPNNPWTRPYTITGSKSGLNIKTDIGENKACSKMILQIKSSASVASCAGSILSVDFNEWN